MEAPAVLTLASQILTFRRNLDLCMPRILFTRETASLMGQRSWAAKQARREAQRSALVVSQPFATDVYVSEELTRTRKQISLLNDILEDRATGWRERKAAAEAKDRLTKIEFGLSGRPWPGNRRPGPDRSPKQAVVECLPQAPPSLPALPPPAQDPPKQ
jgi:hypothetical protein